MVHEETEIQQLQQLQEHIRVNADRLTREQCDTITSNRLFWKLPTQVLIDYGDDLIVKPHKQCNQNYYLKKYAIKKKIEGFSNKELINNAIDSDLKRMSDYANSIVIQMTETYKISYIESVKKSFKEIGIE